MSQIRLEVSPKTVCVLGHRVTATDPAWTGLDWSRAEYRATGWLSPHLGVPWCHPEDQTGSPDDFDCIYRVYALKSEGERWRGKGIRDVRFEKEGDAWFVVYECA